MRPAQITALFDQYLEAKKLTFEAIIIGGSALNILNIISRETVDIDCLDPKIPEAIIAASHQFRQSHPELSLIEKWLNNGPETLVRDLPEGWRTRVVLLYTGKSIRFFTLGRSDLLKSKLFAYCDREDDFADCIAMNPSKEELLNSKAWVSERDANPMWPSHVEGQFLRLGRALKHG